jgi:hypothetical protein
MDKDLATVVRRTLKENRLDAEQALIVLAQTLVARHIDCELVKMGRRIQPQPRLDAFVASMDALHEFRHRNAKTDPKLAGVQTILFQMLTGCQFAAEHAAGMDEEEPGDDNGGNDDPPPGRMRIVRD